LDGIVGVLSADQNRMITAVRHEAERLLHLVRQLLDLARLETRSLELQITPVDLNALIESAITPNALHAARSDIAIDIDVPTSLLAVHLDANKMSWAISNLIANAIKYSPRGARVHVSASTIDGDLWITVTDHGRGIAQNDLQRIFHKFVQIESGKMGGVTGSGLGLAIAREIVQLHGGRIWATSELGAGSRFIISIPYRQ
jgi:signal transduction histidine kinase